MSQKEHLFWVRNSDFYSLFGTLDWRTGNKIICLCVYMGVNYLNTTAFISSTPCHICCSKCTLCYEYLSECVLYHIDNISFELHKYGKAITGKKKVCTDWIKKHWSSYRFTLGSVLWVCWVISTQSWVFGWRQKRIWAAGSRIWHPLISCHWLRVTWWVRGRKIVECVEGVRFLPSDTQSQTDTQTHMRAHTHIHTRTHTCACAHTHTHRILAAGYLLH